MRSWRKERFFLVVVWVSALTIGLVTIASLVRELDQSRDGRSRADLGYEIRDSEIDPIVESMRNRQINYAKKTLAKGNMGEVLGRMFLTDVTGDGGGNNINRANELLMTTAAWDSWYCVGYGCTGSRNGMNPYSDYSVWEKAVDDIRVYMLYKGKPNILFSGKRNDLKNIKLEQYFRKITGDDGYINYHRTDTPASEWRNLTENHYINNIATGMILSRVFEERTVGGVALFSANMNDRSYYKFFTDQFKWWAYNRAGVNAARRGFDESDSSWYMPFSLGPLYLIRDFAVDAPTKKLAEMLINRQLEDFASTQINGIFAGGGQREPNDQVNNRIGGFDHLSYVYFDNFNYDYVNGPASSAMAQSSYSFGGTMMTAAMTSSFVPPRAIIRLARHNQGVRFTRQKEASGFKYVYVGDKYSLGGFVGLPARAPWFAGPTYALNIPCGIRQCAIYSYKGYQADFRDGPTGNMTAGAQRMQYKNVSLTRFAEDYPTKIYVPDAMDSRETSGNWIFTTENVNGTNVYVAVYTVDGEGYSNVREASMDGVLGSIYQPVGGTDVVWVVMDVATSANFASFAGFKSNRLANPPVYTNGGHWGPIRYRASTGEDMLLDADGRRFTVNGADETIPNVNGYAYFADSARLLSSVFDSAVYDLTVGQLYLRMDMSNPNSLMMSSSEDRLASTPPPGGSSSSSSSGACVPVGGGWTDWGSCSVTCGGGVQSRSCANPTPACGGENCSGAIYRTCNTQSCVSPTPSCQPVSGGWGAWGDCTVSCGGGTQSRSCANPTPACGGSNCAGATIRTCNTQVCGIGGAQSSSQASDYWMVSVTPPSEATLSATPLLPLPSYGPLATLMPRNSPTPYRLTQPSDTVTPGEGNQGADTTDKSKVGNVFLVGGLLVLVVILIGVLWFFKTKKFD